VDDSKNEVCLRELRPSDIAVLRGLRLDFSLQHLLLAHPAGSSCSDVDAWIARRQVEEGGLFRIVATSAGDALGFAQIARVHWIDRYGYAGICLAPSARGRGIGKAAIGSLLSIAQIEIGLRKLLLEVRGDNSKALTLYGRAGFRVVGTMAAHYFDGRDYHDVVLMEQSLYGRTGA
jgi:RimJ/RimL family protein N-acetyltransferase